MVQTCLEHLRSLLSVELDLNFCNPFSTTRKLYFFNEACSYDRCIYHLNRSVLHYDHLGQIRSVLIILCANNTLVFILLKNLKSRSYIAC